MHRPESNTDNNIIILLKLKIIFWNMTSNVLFIGYQLKREKVNKKLFQLSLKYLKKIIQYLYTIISRILISEQV